MIKQIQLRGISRTPSDRETADGGCAESLNVYLDGAETAPALEPELISTRYGVEEDFDGKPLFVHKGRTYNNLILSVYNGSTTVIQSRAEGMSTETTPATLYTLKSGESLIEVTAIGNTLILCTNQRMEYILFKEGSYIDLGDEIPKPHVEFGMLPKNGTDSYSVERILKKNFAPGDWGPSEERFGISFNCNLLGYSYEDEEGKIHGWKQFTNTLWGEVSLKLNAIRKKRNMAAPVFVRSALRLYDGSYIYHSVPVLLGPTIQTFFTATAQTKDDNGSVKKWSKLILDFPTIYQPMAYLYSYSYENWKDIIASIDLFMTTEVNNPLMNTEVDDLVEASYSSGITTYNVIFKGIENAAVQDRVENEILSKSIFYRVASFSPAKMSRLSSGYNLLSDEQLASEDFLVTQPVLDDDFQSHHRKYADGTFRFNNRFIIRGVTSTLGSGYEFFNGEEDVTNGVSYKYKLKYYLRDAANRELSVLARNKDGGTLLGDVRTIQHQGSNPNSVAYTETISAIPITWLAYPDSRCYRVDIQEVIYHDGVQYSAVTYKYEMVPHPHLNCSYLYLGIGKKVSEGGGVVITSFTEEEQKVYKEDNIIWASKMDNPFMWPLEGRLSFSSTVLALATSTKALSEGQFGQYPLIVFTADGTWSIAITSGGDFASCVPLTNDVLADSKSVIGIEQAVVFVTRQGVMMLTSSNITPISPNMNGEHFVPDEGLTTILKQHPKLGELVGAFADNTGFIQFVCGASIAYDYPNRKLIFYRPEETYQYIYHLTSGTWHKMCFSGMEYVVGKLNSYPDCYLATRKLSVFLSRNACYQYSDLYVRLGDEYVEWQMKGNRYLPIIGSEIIIDDDAPIKVTPGPVKTMAGETVATAAATYLCSEMEVYGQPRHYIHVVTLDSENPLNGYCDVLVEINGTTRSGVPLKKSETIRLYFVSDPDEQQEIGYGKHVLRDFSTIFDASRQAPSNPLADDAQKALPGLIVTRPLAFDMDDVRKVIEKVSIRGKKNRSDVTYLLYGSMDGLQWQRLSSLRGGSYKWFRLVLLVGLSPAERISWIDVQVEPRMTNRLR